MNESELDALAAMPPEAVADAIGCPLDRWPGNCYGVAVALVESGLLPSGTRAVYGHWRGPIAETSMFANRRALGLTGHGWALTPEGRVVDPTRWVFEDVAPYVYVGPDRATDCPEECRVCGHLEDEHHHMWGGPCRGGDDVGYECGPCLFEPAVSRERRDDERYYDEGGNQLLATRLTPYPPADPAAETTKTVPPADVAAFLAGHGHQPGPLSIAQALWAANLPLPLLGPTAEALYRWLEECGLAALIPIDNRMTVLGGSPTAA